ncbi:PDR/VanB family oxidoreductase [Nocardia sp. NPDC088792]|uniref:PDR/VanB family oxidoreductase n=1 Tax=Nocardia sp. NPDC088792 TaxID=3364332 RepID=UPI003829D67F
MQHAVLDRMDRVTDDVLSLVLRGAETPLAPWEPGAHIDLALPNWLTRQYSLCGDPAVQEHYRIAVRYDPLSRGGSEYVHLFLEQGRTLDISLPRNNFPLLPASHYLFIAGGIGITPILPMMRTATEAGAATTLLYVGRSPETMPFTETLRSTYGDRVRTVATRVDGRPDFRTLATELDPHALVYCCGPTSMMDQVESVFPADRVHIERFRPTARPTAPNTPFEVRCARTGDTVQVPEDMSMLDALKYAGHPLPSGCREGVCGSCELTVLTGTPDHRDDIGAPPARIYPCVSRSLSHHLVVDL